MIWINSFLDRARLQPFVHELASKLKTLNIDAVCGPMTGGAKLAELVADELCLESFYTERFEPPAATGLFPVRYSVPANQRASLRGRTVAIVDDAISAGSAVKGTYEDLLACGARPIACGALILFGNAAEKLAADRNLALVNVCQLPFALWKPDACPLCEAGLPCEKISDAPKPSVGASS
ncbi:phosphoribosyltransferase family protein [Oleiharenicola lentus]|uniref:phosphoribosyltransferase family protein n=1 Tax=Oleiharenicola lentus TaxID=2508720 RepID=UPI003F6796C6